MSYEVVGKRHKIYRTPDNLPPSFSEKSLETSETQILSTESLNLIAASLSTHLFLHRFFPVHRPRAAALYVVIVVRPQPLTLVFSLRYRVEYLLHPHDLTAHLPPSFSDRRIQTRNRVESQKQRHQSLVHPQPFLLVASDGVHRLLTLDHALCAVGFSMDGWDRSIEASDLVRAVARLDSCCGCVGGGGGHDGGFRRRRWGFDRDLSGCWRGSMVIIESVDNGGCCRRWELPWTFHFFLCECFFFWRWC